MTTPEGKIKNKVNKVLKEFGVYGHMPVKTLYGAKSVDYHCVVGVNGLALAFFIETKKPGEPNVTPLQEQFIKDRRAQQYAITHIINCEADVERLRKWLLQLLHCKIQLIRPSLSSPNIASR